MTQLFILSLAVSGLSLSWHFFLEDHPKLKSVLKRITKISTCGICQITWMSLIAAILSRHQLPTVLKLEPLFLILLYWQVLVLLGFVIQYGTLFIIESAKYRYRNNQQN